MKFFQHLLHTSASVTIDAELTKASVVFETVTATDASTHPDGSSDTLTFTMDNGGCPFAMDSSKFLFLSLYSSFTGGGRLHVPLRSLFHTCSRTTDVLRKKQVCGKELMHSLNNQYFKRKTCWPCPVTLRYVGNGFHFWVYYCSIMQCSCSIAQ